MAFITEATWIADTLAQLRPDALCMLVRNGIDKQTFAVPEDVGVRIGEPLRVLVEGNPRVVVQARPRRDRRGERGCASPIT